MMSCPLQLYQITSIMLKASKVGNGYYTELKI